MRKVIAIDFDGCLCKRAWPEIGEPNMEVINAAIREKECGAALILWTCRVGERLGEAVKFCEDLGLTFDAVNANLPERIAAYKNDCRKVNADEYWDDQAVVMGAGNEWRRQTTLIDAVQTWGHDAQIRMMIEEMSELTKELCKLYRVAQDGKEYTAVQESVQWEMADVQIMLDQMKLIFGDTEVKERMKMERLGMRLERAHAAEAGKC